MTKNYFWHTAYDNYPVVGVTWTQAKAFGLEADLSELVTIQWRFICE